VTDLGDRGWVYMQLNRVTIWPVRSSRWPSGLSLEGFKKSLARISGWSKGTLAPLNLREV
jgi:hypothetical protein